MGVEKQIDKQRFDRRGIILISSPASASAGPTCAFYCVPIRVLPAMVREQRRQFPVRPGQERAPQAEPDRARLPRSEFFYSIKKEGTPASRLKTAHRMVLQSHQVVPAARHALRKARLQVPRMLKL